MSLTQEGKKYIESVLNPLKFRLGMLTMLPSVWFWGVKVKHLDEDRCSIHLPYKWSSKNPFKSIYFAAQAGTAELSTGLLVQSKLKGRGKWSMLVTEFQSRFTKKASADVTYTCTDGAAIEDAISRSEQSGKGETVVVTAVGTMADGTQVGECQITWSVYKKPA